MLGRWSTQIVGVNQPSLGLPIGRGSAEGFNSHIVVRER